MRALTGLKKAGMAATGGAAENPGQLPMMALARIHPDPRNKILRDKDALTPEAIAEQRELNADVKKVGIKSPLSLRSHPNKPGDYIINHGHRRRLAALAAGLIEVPYFIDEKFTSYDQVKENLLRRGLTPWAFAEFIKTRESEGESRTEIAEGLGKGKDFVTDHAVLIDPPTCLHVAYGRGVRSARTLYDLIRAYREFPEQVDAWCASDAKITRDTIPEFLQTLRNETTGDQVPDQLPADDQGLEQQTDWPEVRHDVQNEGGQEPVSAAQEHQPAAPEVRHDVQNEGAQEPASTAQEHQPAAPEVRHDVQNEGAQEPASTTKELPSATPGSPQSERKPLGLQTDRPLTAPTAASQPGSVITVQYRGKAAKIAPNTTVQIVVDGQDGPLEVLLTDLVFSGT